MSDETNMPETDGEYGVQYEPKDADENGIPDGAEQKASGAKYESVREAYRAKDGFLSGVGEVIRNTGLGRTIRLKNKSGKVIGLAIAGLASMLIPEPFGSWIWHFFNGIILTQTGVTMDVFTDLSLLQMSIMILPLVIGAAVSYFAPKWKEKKIWQTIDDRLDDVTDEVVKAIDKDSEGGKKITRNELKAIIGSALKKEDLK